MKPNAKAGIVDAGLFFGSDGFVKKLSREESMKIAIVGCGGIGGYYGGLLARAGHDVVFIARGANLGALRQKGLTVYSVHGDFSVAPVRATDNPAEAGVAELDRKSVV